MSEVIASLPPRSDDERCRAFVERPDDSAANDVAEQADLPLPPTFRTLERLAALRREVRRET